MKNRFYSRILKHLGTFWLPWLLLVAMLVVAILQIQWYICIMLGLAAIFILILCIKPMNIIYGLIGTRGNVRYFFILFLLINFLFAAIYYEAFFKKAGITYNLNQPHVEFGMFDSFSFSDGRFWVPDTRIVQLGDSTENLPVNNHDSAHYYYRVTPLWVLKNTLLTSLMQGPTDFFSIANTYTGDNPYSDHNYNISNGLHWFLIFHVLVSWILLGVFISLIYQRFRRT